MFPSEITNSFLKITIGGLKWKSPFGIFLFRLIFRSCSPVVNKVVRNIRSRAVSEDRGDVELEEGEYLSESD